MNPMSKSSRWGSLPLLRSHVVSLGSALACLRLHRIASTCEYPPPSNAPIDLTDTSPPEAFFGPGAKREIAGTERTHAQTTILSTRYVARRQLSKHQCLQMRRTWVLPSALMLSTPQ
jgi:hypothetical protein